MIWRSTLFLVSLALAMPAVAVAHPLQFGVAEVAPLGDGIYRVELRFSPEESSDPSMPLRLSPGCEQRGERVTEQRGTVRFTRTDWTCGTSPPATLRAPSLSGRSERILVRYELGPQVSGTGYLTSYEPALSLDEIPNASAGSQLWFGIEHILTGWDHLLFLLGLFLLISNRQRLILTVTTFTLGHSLTLAWTALGGPHPPVAPTEAVIALSVLLLAVELSRESTSQQSLTLKYPWAVAGLCGLMHGFGFGGAMLSLEVAPSRLLESLLFFSVGVEIGQIGFVLALVLGSVLFARIGGPIGLRRISIYGMGFVSVFWIIDRTVLLVS